MTAADLTPEEIQNCLRVLENIHIYDEEHPDYIKVRRATGKMFKAVKRYRRTTKRDAVNEADRAVLREPCHVGLRLEEHHRGRAQPEDPDLVSAGDAERGRVRVVADGHVARDPRDHPRTASVADVPRGRRDRAARAPGGPRRARPRAALAGLVRRAAARPRDDRRRPVGDARHGGRPHDVDGAGWSARSDRREQVASVRSGA